MILPTIDLEKTGQNIRETRKKAGLSVKEVQAVMGFANPQAIYRWENGSSLPTLDNLVILSSLLGVGIADILSINQGE